MGGSPDGDIGRGPSWNPLFPLALCLLPREQYHIYSRSSGYGVVAVDPSSSLLSTFFVESPNKI